MNQECQECFPKTGVIPKSIAGKKADGSDKKDTNNPGNPLKDKEGTDFQCVHCSIIYTLNKQNFINF